MSNCQKDVKCQKIKHLDYGGGSQKNWHNEVHTYWHQFWCHIWWWPKTLEMSIESILDQFWWPWYVMSKFSEKIPCFHPSKIFLILTLHTLREILDWSLISILTSQPKYEMSSGQWKKIHKLSIYKKTVNHKNSQKVPFGS